MGALYRFVEDSRFSHFITFLIVLNTIILAADHHPMDPDLESNFEIINFTLTALFTIEMVLKLIALGVKTYCQDTFNIFDGVIVTISLVESVISPPGFITGKAAQGGGAISALRSFRLFRIFKLAREWKSMRDLLNTIIKTCFDITNFGFLLILFYVYLFFNWYAAFCK